MREMIELSTQALRVLVATHAVTGSEYRLWLRCIGRPAPASMPGAETPAAPVTNVSQVDATACCEWLGAREGRAYRLPKMAELLELASEDAAEGVDPEIWPHHHGNRPEVRGGMKPMYFCEWTLETEEQTSYGSGQVRVLGSIFYPPWLREGNNSTQVQAHLLATAGYSFITFRVACDAERGTSWRSRHRMNTDKGYFATSPPM